MSELPYMPVYTDAFLADTANLSGAEVGAYTLLLVAAWRRPGCDLPDDDVLLAKIARQPLARWRRAIRPILVQLFTVADGVWRHLKQTEQRAHAADVSDKRRRAAMQRCPPNPLKSNGPAPAIAPAFAPIAKAKEERTKIHTESLPKASSSDARAREAPPLEEELASPEMASPVVDDLPDRLDPDLLWKLARGCQHQAIQPGQVRRECELLAQDVGSVAFVNLKIEQVLLRDDVPQKLGWLRGACIGEARERRRALPAKPGLMDAAAAAMAYFDRPAEQLQ